ncbi:unnamed protein product [Paramecium primaurelia]|uniref:Transmembrane protein n=1 Tax=Paramecium primaurelia TaxID=5886 RepID=A0A8S1MNL7_PARPR|nr:unnamed protein product [Paramecium primaurelia]
MSQQVKIYLENLYCLILGDSYIHKESCLFQQLLKTQISYFSSLQQFNPIKSIWNLMKKQIVKSSLCTNSNLINVQVVIMDYLQTTFDQSTYLINIMRNNMDTEIFVNQIIRYILMDFVNIIQFLYWKIIVFKMIKFSGLLCMTCYISIHLQKQQDLVYMRFLSLILVLTLIQFIQLGIALLLQLLMIFPLIVKFSFELIRLIWFNYYK